MSKRVAVILSGCGFMDGAEIREAVITLLELDRAGAKVSMFAPDIDQAEVNNHLNGESVSEKRNVMAEAARIARGDIKPLELLKEADFDALVIPGGFGVAKNLSTIATKGAGAQVLPIFQQIIRDFFHAKKPIGAICIAPAAVALALKGEAQPTLTLGSEDANNLIAGAGGVHQTTTASEHVVDEAHNIASCAAYMTEEPLAQIAQGISGVVNAVLARA